MPNPIPPPVQGLKQAAPPPTDIDTLIAQREAINGAMSGHPQAPTMAPPVAPGGNPAWAGQPQGWHPPMALGKVPAPVAGLQDAAPSAMDFDELMKRANAIPVGR